MMQLFVIMSLLTQRADAYSVAPGDCSGPAGGHGSAGSSAGTITAPVTATTGQTVSVTLSHGVAFKGFLLKATGGASLSAAGVAGTSSMSCAGVSAVGHSSAAAKSSLTFSTTMPCSAGTVALSGYMVRTIFGWSPVYSTTITVTGASTCGTCAGFDCSGSSNDLDAAPAAINCATATCRISECCTVSPPPPPPPTPATMSLELSPAVTMSWGVAAEAATIDVTYSGSGWVSFGTASTAGAMIGGEVLIGQPGVGVAWHSMSSKMLSGVTANSAAVVCIQAISTTT